MGEGLPTCLCAEHAVVVDDVLDNGVPLGANGHQQAWAEGSWRQQSGGCDAQRKVASGAVERRYRSARRRRPGGLRRQRWCGSCKLPHHFRLWSPCPTQCCVVLSLMCVYIWCLGVVAFKSTSRFQALARVRECTARIRYKSGMPEVRSGGRCLARQAGNRCSSIVEPCDASLRAGTRLCETLGLRPHMVNDTVFGEVEHHCCRTQVGRLLYPR